MKFFCLILISVFTQASLALIPGNYSGRVHSAQAGSPLQDGNELTAIISETFDEQGGLVQTIEIYNPSQLHKARTSSYRIQTQGFHGSLNDSYGSLELFELGSYDVGTPLVFDQPFSKHVLITVRFKEGFSANFYLDSAFE